MADKLYEFRPNYAIHPGEYIAELLEVSGMKQAELALRLGITPKHLSNILHGKANLTPEMAQALQSVFSNYSTKYWLSLQSNYDVFRLKQKEQEEYEKNQEQYDDWLKSFDYKHLVTLGFIQEMFKDKTPMERVNDLLTYFACSDIHSWEAIWQNGSLASCRMTGASTAKIGNTSMWIRSGQILSSQKQYDMPVYSKRTFEKLLSEMRSLTVHDDDDDFVAELRRLCQQAGVCLLLVKEIPRAGISGAAFWIANGAIPCIQMCLRYKTNDHFWFTFFHEAAHILNEDKKIIYLDCAMPEATECEDAANLYARNLLIPPDAYSRFVSRGKFFKPDIIQFAKSINLHPGIVVGRLQHDKHIDHKWHNPLKRKYEWAH